MTHRNHISTARFSSTFPRLVEGRHTLPKKRIELQMLLLSAVLEFEPGVGYSETEVNVRLEHWIARFGAGLSLDHVTLRRFLVDEWLLMRDKTGARYARCAQSPYFSFDESIAEVDLDDLLLAAREKRARRKQAHFSSARD